MRKLPDDVERCSDEWCLHRNRCLRFLQRDTGRSVISTCRGNDKGEEYIPFPLLIIYNEFETREGAPL